MLIDDFFWAIGAMALATGISFLIVAIIDGGRDDRPTIRFVATTMCVTLLIAALPVAIGWEVANNEASTGEYQMTMEARRDCRMAAIITQAFEDRYLSHGEARLIRREILRLALVDARAQANGQKMRTCAMR